jgi:NAD-dependent SIR2 family protein deacetylase
MSDDAEITEILSNCEALLITAGAGIGVDSGLPDFRGTHGLWKAYPPLAEQGLSLPQISTPSMFDTDPELAWGFFGHRLVMYANTVPHEGFKLLLDFAKTKRLGAFVFTSNVDGQFQKAGFSDEQVHEVHGSIHHLQCTSHCSDDIWSAMELLEIPEFRNVEQKVLRLDRKVFPKCRNCGKLARPNILMFSDWLWEAKRSNEQERRLESWLSKVKSSKSRLAILEIGAGISVPTVRNFSEHVVKRFSPNARLIRINPRDIQIPNNQICIPLKSLEALKKYISPLLLK